MMYVNKKKIKPFTLMEIEDEGVTGETSPATPSE